MTPIDFEPVVAAALRALGITGRVLVGVSGGADSVALLCGLVNLRERHSLELVAAHLNHQLRGGDSVTDADFVRKLCESLKVPLFEGRLDIRGMAEENGIGLEEAARNARYEFLTQTAAEQHCPWVLLAHTADDHVETVLHHIVRGTGLDGLRGIPRTRPLTDRVTLARPLLDIRRACIEAYLHSITQVWREDASNRDTHLTRNRIRHELLPVLRDRFNPHIDAAITRLSHQAIEAQAVIDSQAGKLLAACGLDAAPDVLRLNAAPMADSSVHLVREVLKLAWGGAGWPLGGMGFDQWSAAANVALGSSGPVDLPGGVHAERRGRLLSLTRKNVAPRVETRSEPG